MSAAVIPMSWPVNHPALVAEDRRDRSAKHLQQTEDDLRQTVTTALANAKGYVPFVRVIAGKDTVQAEPIAETVSDLLGYDDTLACLMNVLAKSTDPLVDALRRNIVQRVVDGRASDIAEATV